MGRWVGGWAAYGWVWWMADWIGIWMGVALLLMGGWYVGGCWCMVDLMGWWCMDGCGWITDWMNG